jgi:hypothetical protein
MVFLFSIISEGSKLTHFNGADVFRGFAVGDEAPEILKRYWVLTARFRRGGASAPTSAGSGSYASFAVFAFK